MAETVWLNGFEVEVGSPAHERLVAAGHTAGEAAAEASSSYGALKVPELRELVAERELDVPSDAKKADLVAALGEDDAEAPPPEES